MNEKVISPLNRVEGDLDLKVIFEGKKVLKAFPMSRLFRGIEIILKGKFPMDSLVITPRICGICGGSHLLSAAKALEMAYKARVPSNAVRLRNVMTLAEMGQNDVRHTYLMFLIDTINSKYEKLGFYRDMVLRWAPYLGQSYKQAVHWSKRYTEIYAIFGGQWPHGSAMIPGGVTTDPLSNDIIKARSILASIETEFLEKTVLGGPLDQFLELKSKKDLDQWSKDYPNGDVSKIWNYGLEMKWDKIGSGSQFLMSYGHVTLPEHYDPPTGVEKKRFGEGLLDLKTHEVHQINEENIVEFVSHSFYTYEQGDKVGLHPYNGETTPLSPESKGKYTFTKAFRYKLGTKYVAPEVGALAMMVVAGDPLLTDLVYRMGTNVLVREMARIVRLARIHEIMNEELESYEYDETTYIKPEEKPSGRGYGLVEASRGSLGHWIVIEDGKIKNYQVVTPTQINMGPEDPFGNPSHLSMALQGIEVENPNNPIEVAHVVRSHDACMVCNVHVLDGGKEVLSMRL
ncbi:nickel-dependent hydrogenase large subunit [Metallosphaera javensis (ex Sakai et al. 2022)]|uniref:nickel-dependent hydrogenase large subunit n=1 Tax=Metallosphaera javensis (ex Sakai et al. 2022) TaxID=2775498 RepID=UPI002582F2E7|nr:MAG: F420-non-reducing hydrogenase subunit A [Metallosphaera javensis (ex Sakai et al. 2022)]